MTEGKHPTDWKDIDPQWDRDLHPAGPLGESAERDLPDGRFGLTAEASKRLQQGPLRGLTDAQLKEIPVLPVGTRLRQGATYLDLADERRQPFTAMGGMVADEDHYYVPKDDIAYTLWNRLTGVTNQERLDEAGEP